MSIDTLTLPPLTPEQARQADKHYTFACLIAKRYNRDGWDEDQLHDIAMEGLLQAVTTYEPAAAKLSTWIWRKVHFRVRDRRKYLARRPLYHSLYEEVPGAEGEVLMDTLQADAPTAHEEACASLLRDAAVAARACLTVRERQAVELVMDDGLTYIEAAKALGLAESRVCQLLKAARPKMARWLEGRGWL